jgi:hypothetical protein
MGIRGPKVRDPKLSFEIKPRARRDGFTLNSNSKLLLYPLWYPTLNGAISYARFLGKNQDCRIEIFNSQGKLVESKVIHADERQPATGG